MLITFFGDNIKNPCISGVLCLFLGLKNQNIQKPFSHAQKI